MLDIITVMTTAPRQKPTLQRSLESYRAAGFSNEVMLVCDGRLSDETEDALADLNVRVIVTNPPLGVLRNFVSALKQAMEWSVGAPWIMVLEDDIIWARGSAAALEDDLQKQPRTAHCLSLFCARRVSDRLELRHGKPLPPGWYYSRLGWDTWGAQAWVFSRRGAQRLLDNSSFQDFVATHTMEKDRIVGKIMQDLGHPITYRIPSLVHHELGSGNSARGQKPVYRLLETIYWTGQP